jgi:glycosyltransferase involved in cell wall biosynthesis
MSGDDKWNLACAEHIWEKFEHTSRQEMKEIPLVVLLRVRNEELILEDTLNHLSDFADLIVAYEDASTDRTREILRAHPKVVLIIENNAWLSSIGERLQSETRHRGLLLQEARKRWSFRWCMCCDADERYVGDIRGFVTECDYSKEPEGIRISLFDAYMTATDNAAYQQGKSLLNFRQHFGPECRNILMLWKNNAEVDYRGLDAREPNIPGKVAIRFYCQHYGKSLSVEHWEATCEYYVNHFPYDPYGKKWEARRGNSIHDRSDFGRPLYAWGKELFSKSEFDF